MKRIVAILFFCIVALHIYSEEHSEYIKVQLTDKITVQTNYCFIVREDPSRYGCSWEKYLQYCIQSNQFPVIMEYTNFSSWRVFYDCNEYSEQYITNTYYAIYAVATNETITMKYKDIEMLKKEENAIFKFVVKEVKEVIKLICYEQDKKEGWTRWVLWTNQDNFVASQIGLYEFKIDKNGFRWRREEK